MGKLIVLDGLDGSGKSTQFACLQTRLLEAEAPFLPISFPDYEKPSSALVRQYLAGDFSSSAGGVNAYAASSFYAVDRYASYKQVWEEAYLSGKLILASRYVTSNAIHQMGKLPQSEWNSYLDWLAEYEYEKLGLPRPDQVIFLDMPLHVSQRLLSARYDGDETKKDIHEADLDYLRTCRTSALYAAERLGWDVVACSDGENPYSVEQLSETLWNLIKGTVSC
ncbi:MAG: deoxynucleoside kinase [Ruminococcus sp.]|nr:deoxynucleoside kinase [Ruminococcus sp.]